MSAAKLLVPVVAACVSLGCASAPPPQPPVTPIAAPEPTAAPLPPEPIDGLEAHAWRFSRWLGVRVPATEEELDELELVSPHVVATQGRVIFLDLAEENARQALAKVNGPVTVSLPSLEPKLVKAVNAVAKRFPVAVYYQSHEYENPDLSPLTGLTYLQGLNLVISYGNFPDLSGLSRLSWLNLSFGGLTEDTVQRLPTGLQELKYNGPLQLDTIHRMQRFPRLARFQTEVRGFDWSELGQLESLESLQLPDDIERKDLEALGELPRLREFATATRFEGQEFRTLAKLNQLRVLDVPNTAVSDVDAQQLAKFSELEVFIAPHGFTDVGLQALIGLKHLHTLDLHHADRTLDLRMLATLPALRDLGLQGHGVDPQILSKLTTLERLNLNSAGVDTGDVHAIAKLTQLRELDISETSAAERDVQLLLKLKELRVLNVFHTRIRDTGWLRLAKLPKLRVLWIGPGTGMGTCEQLAAMPGLLIAGDISRGENQDIWGPRKHPQDVCSALQ